MGRLGIPVQSGTPLSLAPSATAPLTLPLKPALWWLGVKYFPSSVSQSLGQAVLQRVAPAIFVFHFCLEVQDKKCLAKTVNVSVLLGPWSSAKDQYSKEKGRAA